MRIYHDTKLSREPAGYVVLNMPDHNVAERAMRGVAIGGKKWLLAGSEVGGKARAAALTLIETAKLNGSIRGRG